MKAFIVLARPYHWVKNVFLFAPLVFSRHLFDPDYVTSAVLAFVVFCLTSSAVYVINDIADRNLDRAHPVKSRRPIASGQISPGQAALFAFVLLIGVVLLASGIRQEFQLVVALYFVINLFYSFWLKHVLLVDVFIVAAGFMLRVVAGALAIHVEVSHWLILCTLFVSLFLAVSKRRGELMLVQNSVEFTGRAVLREYELPFLDQIITISAAGMAISYALYTVADRTVSMFGTENLIFTTVFVLFGIFRYMHILRKRSTEDNPTYLLLTDPALMVNITLWFLSCIVIIYWHRVF